MKFLIVIFSLVSV